MQKLLICLFAAVCLGIGLQCVEAQAETYACVRPDGGIVCTINAGQTDPSVQCNKECLDCNMVCTAQIRIISDGDQVMTTPSRTKPGRHRAQVPSGTVETPRYCQQQYANCEATCRSNPNNRDNSNLEACISSCKSIRSGCGRRP